MCSPEDGERGMPLYPRLCYTSDIFAQPTPNDGSGPLNSDDVLPRLEPFTGTSLPYPKSASLYTGNLFSSTDFAEAMRVISAPGAAQAQLGELDDGVNGHFALPPQRSSTTFSDFQSSFDIPAHDGYAMTDSKPVSTAVSCSVSGAIPAEYNSTGQGSDAFSTGFNVPASWASSGIKPSTDEPELESDGYRELLQRRNKENKSTHELNHERHSTWPISTPTNAHLIAAWPRFDDGTDSSFGGLQCPHPSCASKVLFMRQRDFYKHYRLHFRKYYCRFPNCHLADKKPRSFALRKDRNRHEMSHKPSLSCPYCVRLFSRQDNLRDHCRRRHHEST